MIPADAREKAVEAATLAYDQNLGHPNDQYACRPAMEAVVDALIALGWSPSPVPMVGRVEFVERVAAMICAKPIAVADSLRLWQRYLDEDERQEWRKDATEILDGLISANLLRPLPTEEEIAEALVDHDASYTRNPHTWDAWWGCGCGERYDGPREESPDWHRQHRARAILALLKGERR